MDRRCLPTTDKWEEVISCTTLSIKMDYIDTARLFKTECLYIQLSVSVYLTNSLSLAQ